MQSGRQPTRGGKCRMSKSEKRTVCTPTGVRLRSPGSRSAPWVEIPASSRTPNGVPQCGGIAIDGNDDVDFTMGQQPPRVRSHGSRPWALEWNRFTVLVGGRSPKRARTPPLRKGGRAYADTTTPKAQSPIHPVT